MRKLAYLRCAIYSSLALSLFGSSFAIAQETEAVTASLAYYALDNVFLLFCAVLVFMMQPGFALLEAGLNPVKNTVHVTCKNMIDLSFGILLFYFVGYSLMYGADASGGLGLIGWSGFGISSEVNPADIGPGTLHPQVDWLFQVAFAATAATIVGGAITGRMTLKAYMYYTVFMTAIVYPISGYWKWGGGWLDQLGFYDFAGSIVVHSVGGFAALAGIIVLGPRIGRFNRDGSVNPIPGHSMVLSGLGVFILWIGWFGFNPGSQLAFSGSINTNTVMLIAVNTTLAAASGASMALIYGWITSGRPQVLTTLNGILAGLMDYTVDHFAHEEKLMEKYDYPETPLHKEIHGHLKNKVVAYKNELFKHDTFNAREFQDFMTGWLVNHILEEDRRYAEFINAKLRGGGKA